MKSRKYGQNHQPVVINQQINGLTIGNLYSQIAKLKAFCLIFSVLTSKKPPVQPVVWASINRLLPPPTRMRTVGISVGEGFHPLCYIIKLYNVGNGFIRSVFGRSGTPDPTEYIYVSSQKSLFSLFLIPNSAFRIPNLSLQTLPSPLWEGGGASRRMRWKGWKFLQTYRFTALNAPTPHQSLRDSFP